MSTYRIPTVEEVLSAMNSVKTSIVVPVRGCVRETKKGLVTAAGIKVTMEGFVQNIREEMTENNQEIKGTVKMLDEKTQLVKSMPFTGTTRQMVAFIPMGDESESKSEVNGQIHATA